MRTFLLTALAIVLMAGTASAQMQGPYEQLGGQDVSTALHNADSGVYLPLYDLAEQDTVWAWVEHVREGEKPDYDSAARADVVMWCYPQEHPYPTHVAPETSGKIFVRQRGSTIWITDDR